MDLYRYSFTQRLFYRIRRFFLKLFILIFVFSCGFIYFFNSNFGNDVSLIKDFKIHTNQELSSLYESQTTSLSNSVRKDLGLLPVQTQAEKEKEHEREQIQKNSTHPTGVNPTSSKGSQTGNSGAPTIVNPTNTGTSTNNGDNSNRGTVTENENISDNPNNSGFTTYKIPFYYDHSNAPSGVSKQEALSIISRASDEWNQACGVTFEYKGDKLADYVDNQRVIGGTTGIIKWETQMVGSAIGEAHVGNSHGPASGFVLALFSDFFNHNKADLINTITHEMGHVIGLEHSANKNSIMFPSERPVAKLLESDKAMCRYFRYRWSGLGQKQAEDKAGVVSNGGYHGSNSTSSDSDSEDDGE